MIWSASSSIHNSNLEIHIKNIRYLLLLIQPHVVEIVLQLIGSVQLSQRLMVDLQVIMDAVRELISYGGADLINLLSCMYV